ncbi:MAG: PAS domain S-box protein [Gallionella sp.]|nr:PAS domain S-box protein [Gallionella sp.]
MNKRWDGVERRNTAQLRELAEAMLANIMPVQVQKRPVEELLHELQIQHLELEMQAEQLRSAQNALEESRDRYVSLYDFAPVGYLTLTDAGLIAEVNLTGAALLGVERKKLLQGRFTKFIAPEDRDRWYQHFSRALQQGGKQNGELALVRADGTVFHARLDCLHIAADGKAGMMRITFTDVTECKRLKEELEESRQILRDLADKVEMLREEERKCIAREVHDELGQILTALRMDVALINLRFGEHNAALLEKTQGMSLLLDQAGRSVRNIVSNLRPTALDTGIVAAVGWLCDEFAAHTGSPCVLHTNEEHIDLEEGRAVAVFRIVQELLTNVARHAGASRTQITLTRHAGKLQVEVRDNGKGFDFQATPQNKSFGLLGVFERAIALGGNVEVVSAPQQGTAVTISMPTKLNGDSR